MQKDDRHRGRQVQISFDDMAMSYKIRDLGIGLGAYARIEHAKEPYVLHDN